MHVVTFTLARVRGRDAPRAFLRVPVDRRELARTPGLRFARLLGCARGQSFGWRPDLRRWALLAVWDDSAAADRFERESPVARRLGPDADEAWSARLRPLAAKGAWDGVAPFDPVVQADGGDAPLLVLTRATLRARQLPAFRRAVPPVDAALARAPGLLASVGVGETPVVRQGTVSLWRSPADLHAFAYAAPAHLDAIRRRRDEGWYAEELFARFAVVEHRGTWGGRDPVQPSGSSRG